MLRFVAPAGAPIQVSQVLRAAGDGAFGNGKSGARFEAMAGTLKARHLWGVSSGRAALTLILRALRRMRPDRDVVVLPAYTCYTVAGAIARAGLRLHPVEIDPATLDFNPRRLAELQEGRILCILTSNLFGLVNDSDAIRAAANARGAFLVDDAAQALGASRRGTAAGLLGDVGFYSFGRGKAIAAMQGGLIITNSDDIAAAIRTEEKSLTQSSRMHSLALFCQLLVYAVFLQPRLFWIPNSIPFLKFGTTEFDDRFSMDLMPGLIRNLLPRLLAGLENVTRVRRQNAASLAAIFHEIPCFDVPRPSEGCLPNYIRFPILAKNQAMRDRTVQMLRSQGIGATPFYPGAICDIEGIAPHMALQDYHCPAAEDIGRRLFTVPTHPYVTQADVHTIHKTVRKVASE